MAKLHKIKRRIKSVGKIKQITKAMERVAASKMRRAQVAALAARPYAYTAREILAQLFVLTDPSAHPLFAQRPVRRRLLIIFSSDRGLAGAYNSNVLRLALEAVAEAASDIAPPRCIAIGRKGAQFAAKLERAGRVEVLGSYVDWPSAPTSVTVQPVVDTVMTQFRSRAVDAVNLLYTDYVSGLKHVATRRQLLPILPADVVRPEAEIGEVIREAIFEPSPRAVLNHMVPRLLAVQLYQALLEAMASEHSMRMVAMKNASDNAEQLIGDLALTYHSARQAAITQELAEISAGVEAMRT